MLVNRFRIFRTVSEICSVDWIRRFSNVIIAGMILHNICLHMKELVALRATFVLDEEDRKAADFKTVSDWYVSDPAINGLKVY